MKKEFRIKGSKKVGNRFKEKDVKVSITTRFDQKVVAWLRQESEKKGIPYQTLINSILTVAMNTESQELLIRKIVQEELRKAGYK